MDAIAEYLIKIEDFSQLLQTMLKDGLVNKITGDTVNLSISFVFLSTFI